MNNGQAGDFFGWKSGYNLKTVADFTRESLEENGWTEDVLKSVAEGYHDIANITPSNPSEYIRFQQLESLLKLF